MELFYDSKISLYRVCGETGVPVDIKGIKMDGQGRVSGEMENVLKVYSDDGKTVVRDDSKGVSP